jgi:hypothetical protein
MNVLQRLAYSTDSSPYSVSININATVESSLAHMVLLKIEDDMEEIVCQASRTLEELRATVTEMEQVHSQVVAQLREHVVTNDEDLQCGPEEPLFLTWTATDFGRPIVFSLLSLCLHRILSFHCSHLLNIFSS